MDFLCNYAHNNIKMGSALFFIKSVAFLSYPNTIKIGYILHNK